ncbi:MAG: hypothetical protein MI741_00800 [Rhodospirillales bacterium]|nr:hypothetical protein [Rhodospirillales bacterium]
MGWKGTVRSLAAAARAAERDAQRRHKQALKEQMISEAAEAVADWEDYIEKIISLHKNLVDPINWQKTASQPQPQEPTQKSVHSEAAEQALSGFKPSFFHVFQGGSEKKRKRLEEAIERARAIDAAEFEEAKAQYANDLNEWESDTQIAKRLLAGDAKAFVEVIEEFQSLLTENFIGKSISFSVSDGIIHAIAEVGSQEIVPDFRRKQLASGKLSETNMPKAQFNEIYQDYVVSASLKIAGDLFRILPIKELYVTCTALMLNTQTGHQESTPILSVHFVKETVDRLNFARLDPSDSLSNFNHSMNFKKTKSFSPIDPLKPID